MPHPKKRTTQFPGGPHHHPSDHRSNHDGTSRCLGTWHPPSCCPSGTRTGQIPQCPRDTLMMHCRCPLHDAPLMHSRCLYPPLLQRGGQAASKHCECGALPLHPEPHRRTPRAVQRAVRPPPVLRGDSAGTARVRLRPRAWLNGPSACMARVHAGRNPDPDPNQMIQP